MIDFEFYISLYGDKHTGGHPIFGFPSESIKTERSEHNEAVGYFYPSEKKTDISVFLADSNALLFRFLREAAYPALYAFFKQHRPETAAGLENALFLKKNDANNGNLPDWPLLHECLSEAARYARQNGLWELLKGAAPLDWGALATDSLLPLLTNAGHRPGAFLMGLLGIEEQVLHLNIGYRYQCNFEMSAETMAEIAKMGLVFTFSCYEQEIEKAGEEGEV